MSRQCIKPSSPTPIHLMFYKLCLLDHYQNHRYLSLFFYYALNLSRAAVNIDLILSNRLQLPNQSQSETLVQYYPLVGNLTEIYSIDCNDEGIVSKRPELKVLLMNFSANPIYTLSINLFQQMEMSKVDKQQELMRPRYR